MPTHPYLQDMPFFDTAASGADLLHALREEALTYQEAVSDKLGSFLQGLACFLGGMVSGCRPTAGRGSRGCAGVAAEGAASRNPLPTLPAPAP